MSERQFNGAKGLGKTSDNKDLLDQAMYQQYKDAIVNENQPSFLKRLMLGNFAYDDYPDKPSAIPFLNPPAAPYSPVPNPGNYQKPLSATQQEEFLNSIQLPEAYRGYQGANVIPPNAVMAPKNANGRFTLDVNPTQGTSAPPRKAPGYMSGFIEGDPGPGYDPAAMAMKAQQVAQARSAWDRFKSQKSPGYDLYSQQMYGER